MRVAFFTLGCKVNQYESEVMASLFASEGFDVVSSDDDADVYVINSCTVTASGDKKTKQVIRRFKKLNPDAIIALTGCFPQAFPEDAQRSLEVDVIQGSYNRGAIVKNVKLAMLSGDRVVDIVAHTPNEKFEAMSVKKITDNKLKQHTRAFIKIEDGCDRYCTYCIIPMARGPIRSKELEDIKSEVIGLVANGYKEIVLVGINLCSYGKEKGDIRLVDAIELVCSIEGVDRVRLGSLEPELLLDEDLARMAKLTKFCPQFHLSLQSGCDETLKRMNRHYNSSEYYGIIEKIRSQFVNSSITTDIMVGFAGETEEEFQESISFAQKVKFAKVHVFSYSIRQGTKAATMGNQVPQQKKELRSKQMIKACFSEGINFLNTQVGLLCDVLFETEIAPETFVGYTKNYTSVIIKSKENLCGQIVKVKIGVVENEHCIGSIVNNN